MAQHYRIQGFPQKRMRDIEKGIRSNFGRFGKYGMRGSLRYIYNEDLTKAYKEASKRFKDIEVYLANYLIPKSICGDDSGCFEIHWNTKLLVVEEIYLPL